jgi:hypothetical protein
MTKERDVLTAAAGAAVFSPSPEILFLVQQQAKTLSSLSAISKRLDELEVRVCDIQRTVTANNSSSSSKSKTKTTTADHLMIASSSKCSASGQQLNVLSDDSGGEYSRTTSGTNVDEDELISLLDQIAKYSQTIRDTQQTQAQQQLASMAISSPQHHHSHHPPAVSQQPLQQSSAVSRGLHPDTRSRDHHNHHHSQAVDHSSSSPAVLMNDHPASQSSSAARLLHHHHPAHHNHNQGMHQQQQQQQHQQQHRNPSLTHASHPTRSSVSAFPALRATTSSDRREFRSSGHVAAAPPAESNVSSLGALLFDPNLSSVLTNLLTPPTSRPRNNRDF